MEMKDTYIKTVCFTGHRHIPAEVMERLPALLREAISDLCNRGATTFRAGGAIGFDTLAALTVLDMKKLFPKIRLELILPCGNQTEHWDEESVRIYRYILAHADDARFLFDRYMEGCMQERDRRLALGADVCLAFCACSHGGTAFTCAQAMKNGAELVNLFDLLPLEEREALEGYDPDEE